MTHLLLWYLVTLIISFSVIIPTMEFFQSFRSEGFAYARVVGVAFLSLFVWLTLKLDIGISVISASLFWLLMFFALSVGMIFRNRSILERLWLQRKKILMIESIWIVLFGAILFARSLAPDAIATEKPMDLMIITSIFRSEVVPPPDPWFSGVPLSYHHLGHLSAVIVGKLSQQSIGMIFNLVLASSAATAGAVAALLAIDFLPDLRQLSRRKSVLIVTFTGFTTLCTLFLLAPWIGVLNILFSNGYLTGIDLQWLNVENFPFLTDVRYGIPDQWWWWWYTTRVFDSSFAEFPAFTFLLGDPHAHVFGLPIVLTLLAVGLSLTKNRPVVGFGYWFSRPFSLIYVSGLLAALCMTNVWDLPISFVGLVGAVWLCQRYNERNYAETFKSVLSFSFPIIILVGIILYPFFSGLNPPTTGISLVIGEHTNLAQLVLFWGPMFSIMVGSVLWNREQQTWSYIALKEPLRLTATILLVWVVALLTTDNIDEIINRSTGWLTLGLLICGAFLTRLTSHKTHDQFWYVYWVMGLVLLLLIGTELVRIEDAFSGRLNTLFKAWFISWGIASVAAGGIFGTSLALGSWQIRPNRISIRASLVIVLILFSFSSIAFAPAMAISRGWEGQIRGLDATKHVQLQQPGLAEAVAWAVATLDSSEDVVLQAVGESYEGGNMFSTLTGLPTVLAWPNHERQWRKDIRETERRTAIDNVYLFGAAGEGLASLAKYNINHVLIGDFEKRIYGADVGARFRDWEMVFESSDSKIRIFAWTNP